jgi:hypothetical protein
MLMTTTWSSIKFLVLLAVVFVFDNNNQLQRKGGKVEHGHEVMVRPRGKDRRIHLLFHVIIRTVPIDILYTSYDGSNNIIGTTNDCHGSSHSLSSIFFTLSTNKNKREEVGTCHHNHKINRERS